MPAGSPCRSVYLTNLYNHVLPLIRFEVTDEGTVLDGPCPCGSAFRAIADPQGRLDDTFHYAGAVRVHPQVFRSAPALHHQIVEYQVRQTPLGADIYVVADGQIHKAPVTRSIETNLRALGLHEPARVAAPERQTTGKLKRFVSLPA